MMDQEIVTGRYFNGPGMRFVLCPAGEFMMGSEDPDEHEFVLITSGPVHHVMIEKPFFIGKFPVMQQEWRAVMGTNPSKFKGEMLPVENVSWDDCQEFLRRLNAREDGVYRLPSEAEWEYACRAGDTTRFTFGDDETHLGQFAWIYGNSRGETHSVGKKKPNVWGIHDMHGNVWEWCQDRWHDGYEGAPSNQYPWNLKEGADRVIRGGCFFNDGSLCTSANRGRSGPSERDQDIGVRIVREVEED